MTEPRRQADVGVGLLRQVAFRHEAGQVWTILAGDGTWTLQVILTFLFAM
jgi:hypothetical protein